MGRKIVVSDLHIDTWTNAEVSGSGKSRMEHFFDFLDRIEKNTEYPKVEEFIINGDLMDFPPYKTLHTFTGPDTIPVQVINRLLDFATRFPVTYTFGNHDIGVSGIRALDKNSLSVLNRNHINLCYPAYVVDGATSGYAILIEHGHFYDPVTKKIPYFSYAHNLVKRMYGGNLIRKFHWAMQSAGTELPHKEPPRPGLLEPIKIQPGETLYEAVLREGKAAGGELWDRFLELLDKTVGISYKKYRWSKAAFNNIGKFIEDGNISNPKTVTQIFGHTHRADVKEESIGGVQYNYYNCGTWEEKGDIESCTYLDIDENGKVWMHDWARDPDEKKRL